jgi:transcriptional regulator with XRE-family HTH domain
METHALLDRLLAQSRGGQQIDAELARLLRRRAGLTQAELAAAVRVTRPTLSRWESGIRKPRGSALARYQAALERLAAIDRLPGGKTS